MQKLDLKKLNKINKGLVLSYIFTAVFTIFTLLIVIYILGIYPFGDKTYIWTDGRQYFGLEHYYGTILGVNDIFYSWCNALGGNALSQLAYYSASPYNIIFILFNNRMIFAAHAVVYLKILSSSITFCICLNYFYKNNDFVVKALLSTCYAFMGYMVFYGWNASWMDGIIMLPIMVIGICEIIKGKNILIYVFSLAFALVANFYIGYMLCLTSIIFYVALTLLFSEKFWIGVKTSFVKYAFASLISVGFCAFLLIPTYLSILDSRKKSILEIFNEMSLNIQPADILSGLFTGQVNSLDENAPLIYVGILAVILVILFFVSSKINQKKKLVAGALILIYVFSFQNSFINIIWHGLSINAWYNYRYSFVLSFIFLFVAYEAYVYIRNGTFSKNEYLVATGILLAIAFLVMQDANEKIQMLGITADLVFAVILIVFLIQKYYDKKIFNIALSVCTIFLLICNSCLYLKDYETLSITAYSINKSIMEDAFQTIDDSSFYRMDKSFSQGNNDGNLFNYRGVSNFASTENKGNEHFIKRLGIFQQWMQAKYNTNLPVATESLLGLKYILTDTINGKDYEVIGNCETITYYKNQYALPVLFASSSIENFSMDELDDFDILNTIWKSINGIDKEVFTKNTIENSSTDLQKKLTVTVENDGLAYLYIPKGAYTSIWITGLAENREVTYGSEQEIYYIGELNAGDVCEIYFETSDENYNLDSIVCATENLEVIEENAELVNQQDLNIQEISSSHLEIEYSGDSKIIATTIPFDEGWSIYDNGQLVETEKNWNNFVAFQLDDSEEHHIELIYRPVGYSVGVKIGVASLVLFLIYELFELKKSRKKKTQLT